MIEPLSEPTPLLAAPDPPKRWYARPWVITWLLAVGGGIVIFTFCAALQLLGSPMYTLMTGMLNQMDMVSSYGVIDEYMTAMYYGDAERAYRYYSEATKESLSLSDLEAELTGSRADLYATYTGWEMGMPEQPVQRPNPGAVTFDDAMEGMLLAFDGIVYYESGSRYFRAEVVFEDGEWKLDLIDFNASPGDSE